MYARALSIALAAISASFGFIVGFEAAPADESARRREPTPPSVALPSPPPCAPPTTPLPPPSPAALPLPVGSVAQRSSPRAPAPPVVDAPAAPRSASLLSGFRFMGVGTSGGLRLARVRPGTLPAALGLQSGDELLTINDFRLSDPAQALTAYARLRYADRLQLVVSRNGQQTAIVYFVR